MKKTQELTKELTKDERRKILIKSLDKMGIKRNEDGSEIQIGNKKARSKRR